MSKKITQLPEVQSAQNAALIPIVEQGATSQITKANLLAEVTAAISALNTLLASDDTDLDQLQELVDFIKTNKSTLDSLTVASIAGLQAALDAKAVSSHNHTVAQVTGFEAAVSANATVAANTAHTANTSNPHGVSKAQVGLSNVINTLQLVAADVQDALTSSDTNKPLSANQGRILKGLIDNINTLLSSDETTLDSLQEVVDFIQTNKATLDALGIANIAGLQTALDGKAPLSHDHDGRYYTETEIDTQMAAKAAATHSHSISEVTGLQTSLDSKAPTTHTAATDNPHNVTKAQVGLSNVIDALQLVAADVNDTLTSTETAKPLSANQGRILKGLIDNINTLLTSDTSTLDSLQEIVDFIELNRSDLDALGISSITGLQTALDGKANVSHSHLISEITNLQATLDAKAAASHNHSIANVTGLQNALDGKTTEAYVNARTPQVTVATTAPATPATGDVWIDTN